MPYTNITFVKVEMKLLEDDRFLIDLNDVQKGLYLMLLALAGKTDNKIRNDMAFIKQRLNLKSINEADVVKISEIFPKFTLKNGYWKFRKFEQIHNYTIGKKRKSEGIPSSTLGIVQKENKKEKKEVEVPQSSASPFLKSKASTKGLHFKDCKCRTCKF